MGNMCELDNNPCRYGLGCTPIIEKKIDVWGEEVIVGPQGRCTHAYYVADYSDNREVLDRQNDTVIA